MLLVDLQLTKVGMKKTLYNKVKAQFPEELCKGIEFEFVKNGVSVKPIFASGIRINENILLKGIASTGVVYVRLLVEDDPDEVRIPTGHGKPGKSWNFIISFSRPGKS